MPRLDVRHDQRQRRLRRVVGAALGRPLDVDPVAAEHEQVEIHLARTPTLALLAAERPLEPLEREQQRDGARAPASRPAGTSSATTAFRNSGWSSDAHGSVA